MNQNLEVRNLKSAKGVRVYLFNFQVHNELFVCETDFGAVKTIVFSFNLKLAGC
jgi:hypothetical protein